MNEVVGVLDALLKVGIEFLVVECLGTKLLETCHEIEVRKAWLGEVYILILRWVSFVADGQVLLHNKPYALIRNEILIRVQEIQNLQYLQ